MKEFLKIMGTLSKSNMDPKIVDSKEAEGSKKFKKLLDLGKLRKIRRSRR